MITLKKLISLSLFLPPLEEFMPYLEKIWQEKWLTNNGSFHRQLEAKIACFLFF